MTGHINAGGHEMWIPIPLDVEPEEFHELLMERFSESSGKVDVDANASVMIGALRQMQELNRQMGDDGLLNLAGWALIRKPEVLAVRGFATLTVTSMGSDQTVEDCVAGVIGDEQPFQEPIVEPMETKSGEAISLRFRPMAEDNEVHQVTAVLWPRPADQGLYLLSNYCEDLIEAAEIGDLMDELAAGIEGL